MADGSRVETMDARDIAEALKISKRGVIKRATKDGWAFSETRASGGLRRNYHFATLPEDVRAAVARHRALQAASKAPETPAEAAGRQAGRSVKLAGAVATAITQRDQEQGHAAAAALTGRSAERMQAKLELLARLDAFAQARQVGKCAALDEFCDAYNSGALCVPGYVRSHTGADLHPATLRRWSRELKAKGSVALAGRYGNRKGTGVIDTDEALQQFVLGVLAEKPTISAKLMHDAIEARMPARLPKKRTLERWLDRWKRENAALHTALVSPDGWKNKHMPAYGSYVREITRTNQRWMMDSTPADVMLADGRHSLIGAIDVATRRLKLYVSRTSSAEAVCQLMRRTIIAWGVPESVKIDNGRDYASQRFAGLLAALQVEARFSTPFAPWEKPLIERAFRTFSHHALTLLDDYIGHDVAEAQAIRSRKSFAELLFEKNAVVPVRMTAAELQAFCDLWCEGYYQHEPHSGEGMDGMSPFQRAAQLGDTVRRVQDVRALDLLMGAGAMCTVQKKGIRYEKLTYVSADLPAVGERVLVRRDDADVGRIVVYHNDAFCCIAECPDVTGVSMAEIGLIPTDAPFHQQARG